MTALWACLGIITALAALILSARRQGAAQAQSAATAAAEKFIINQLRARDEIDASINADTGLLDRARRVMQPDAPE